MKKKGEEEQAKRAIKVLVDKVHPNPLVVYSTSSDEATNAFLKYAVDTGIRIVMPNNWMKKKHDERRALK